MIHTVERFFKKIWTQVLNVSSIFFWVKRSRPMTWTLWKAGSRGILGRFLWGGSLEAVEMEMSFHYMEGRAERSIKILVLGLWRCGLRWDVFPQSHLAPCFTPGRWPNFSLLESWLRPHYLLCGGKWLWTRKRGRVITLTRYTGLSQR